MCLSPETIILFHNKAIAIFGGETGVLSEEGIWSLPEYVEVTGERYGWDEIERICLAAYQLVKGHFFLDGNKRTANYVLMNCLRDLGYKYTGRPKDLVDQIISLATSHPNKKEDAILEVAYFLKAHLQAIQPLS